MSVVHIKNRITSDSQSFYDYAASDRSLLWLAKHENVEAFSVDLTVGDQWSEKYGPTSNEMHKISAEGMRILRHGSIVVTAAENIRVPHNMYGILVPTGSLFLDKGILIAPAKVEPSFSGNLKLRLFNTTALKHILKTGDKLGSVIFFSTETTQFQNPVTKNSVLVSKPTPIIDRISHWLGRNVNQLITWMVGLLGGSMMAALLVHFVLQPYFPTAPKPSELRSTLSSSPSTSAASSPSKNKVP